MKLKVLFILHSPPPIHGAAVVGEQIINSITINREFNCEYINLSTSKSLDSIGQISFAKYLAIVKLMAQVFFKLIIFRPNIVYITPSSKGIAVYRDAFIARLIKAFKVPIVAHLHNKGTNDFEKSTFTSLALSWLFDRINIILLSDRLKGEFSSSKFLSNYYICHNGISDGTQFEDNKSLVISNPMKFLFFSNLFESKGVLILLDALKLLKNRNSNFICVIAGQEGDLNYTRLNQLLIELNIQDNVLIQGSKFGVDKENLFKNSDLFIHPTLDDCFPLVLVEALMFSLPVVTTIEGGIPDIIDDGENGYLIEKGNSNVLADKLLWVLDNREKLVSMSQKARIKYERNFTMEIFENRFIQVLKSILSKKENGNIGL